MVSALVVCSFVHPSAGNEPAPPDPCNELFVSRTYIDVGEGRESGGTTECLQISAPNECCWQAAVIGAGGYPAPNEGCGSHELCIHISSCNYPNGRWDFNVQVANRYIRVLCANRTPSPTVTTTPQLPYTRIVTRTPTPTVDATDTPTGSPGSPTPSPSPTNVGVDTCPGDCDLSDEVTVEELLVGVSIALGTTRIEACVPADVDSDGVVAVSDLVSMLSIVLDGCP